MEGDTLAVTLILVSALLHATWNALFKGVVDGVSASSFLGLFGTLFLLPATLFVPWPSATVWAYIGGSVLLHIGYQNALIRMMRAGDMLMVYPIARGSGPLVVTLFAITLLDEKLTIAQIAGILTVALGAGVASLKPGGGHLHVKPLLWALAAGFFIGAYTVVDGSGMKVAGDQASAFLVWALAIFSPFLIVQGYLYRGPQIFKDARQHWRALLPMSLFSYGGYAIAMVALKLGNLAEIAALRETSILFAIVLGTLFLKETLTPQRLAGALIITTGAITLRLV